MFLGVLLLGLLVEAGHIYIVRRQLQNEADSAAT